MKGSRTAAGLLVSGLIVLGPTARATTFESWTFRATRPAPAPSMTQSGPYGSPFLIAPAAAGIVVPSAIPILGRSADLGSLRPQDEGSLRQRIVPGESRIGPDPDDDETDDRPVRPGTLTTNPVRIPTFDYRIQPRPVVPHLNPDVTFELDSRTSIGVFSETSPLDGKPGASLSSGLRGRDADSRAGGGVLPGLKAKDIGAGITLQYRFGQ